MSAGCYVRIRDVSTIGGLQRELNSKGVRLSELSKAAVANVGRREIAHDGVSLKLELADVVIENG